MPERLSKPVYSSASKSSKLLSIVYLSYSSKFNKSNRSIIKHIQGMYICSRIKKEKGLKQGKANQVKSNKIYVQHVRRETLLNIGKATGILFCECPDQSVPFGQCIFKMSNIVVGISKQKHLGQWFQNVVVNIFTIIIVVAALSF